MRRVVIESPYKGSPESPWGDVDRNLRYLRAAMADCFRRGEAPFASHGLYTQDGVLDDKIPEERKQGIQGGLVWGDLAEARVVYTDLGITPGMVIGIDRACHERVVCILDLCGPCWRDCACFLSNWAEFDINTGLRRFLAYLKDPQSPEATT